LAREIGEERVRQNVLRVSGAAFRGRSGIRESAAVEQRRQLAKILTRDLGVLRWSTASPAVAKKCRIAPAAAGFTLSCSRLVSRRGPLRRTLRVMGRELTLRIVIESPPAGVDYALQKGSGSGYEPVQKQRSTDKDLQFEFTPSIRDGVSDPMRALSGPYVQGPPRQRFVYIDIGAYAGQATSPWSRRLKIPLAGISRRMIEAGGVIEARVPGRDGDGGPNCATVKDFEGWKPRKQ